MEALPYYKWHWQDWRANRRVQRMPWQSKGPYRELLDELWAEGSLPTDMPSLADVVGCTEAELVELWPHISPCFQERDGRLYNAKMDAQRTASDRARVAMATGGYHGGRVSNSLTRVKGTLDQPLSEGKGNQGKPDIEEKTREEEIREDKTSDYVTAWNGHCSSLPSVQRLTDGRRKKILARNRQGIDLQTFVRAVQVCASTPFLTGKNDRNWRADFDWLIENDTNIAKVLEGKYSNGHAVEAHRQYLTARGDD